ncbi:MAG TPA: hypothetical protein DDW94_10515 [Deltaproteobacteria bacterium]|nr:MAG: hypothetical protein A2Z79_11860 [Deltaproteobacteria bacterium GWA2_55_82]OGQ63562.1 MAG: hypothetical protein A3I81_06050 [Deltaproteobacteria bacterium RIFCSPLOWO2_02_FULL_55_12]OIJ74943.1 MAG: hypothetical protein A2V21_312105 [Deltaproteobacteria bacterium GWC2_55_46]HBG47402.1 hypothetical protein [Deltaproteobacteria bacterium]HCY11418.1 hypothetical protein [Deltaproteobacteria bacterium]
MARKMNLNEFVSFEEGLSSQKAALEEQVGGAEGPSPIPQGVYYVVSDARVLLLSVKSCSLSQ